MYKETLLSKIMYALLIGFIVFVIGMVVFVLCVGIHDLIHPPNTVELRLDEWECVEYKKEGSFIGKVYFLDDVCLAWKRKY